MIKIYKNFSEVMGCWVYYAEQNRRWYVYFCGTEFMKDIWYDEIDHWNEAADDQTHLIKYNIIRRTSPLDFLVSTGKDLKRSLKEI